MSDLICLFAKPPAPGLSKTRLIPALGPEGAAAMARAFLLDTWASLGTLAWARRIVATTGQMPPELGITADDCWLQGDGDLGARIERIMSRGLEQAARVYSVGADSPTLPATRLDDARAALDKHDAVLGPSEDGGYYLVALSRCPPGLFSGLPWSSPKTLDATEARMREHGMRVARLDTWYDVDTPDDLDRLARDLRVHPNGAPHTRERLARST